MRFQSLINESTCECKSQPLWHTLVRRRSGHAKPREEAATLHLNFARAAAQLTMQAARVWRAEHFSDNSLSLNSRFFLARGTSVIIEYRNCLWVFPRFPTKPVVLVFSSCSLLSTCSAMVDLKQQLDVLDYFGPLAVWISFFAIIFIISVTCILWCCVTENDDSTVFAKVASSLILN